ncbi:MAG: hypothetical protein FWE07_01360 [Turicibacter sp.]|nr:hypothetical protein [Turicibacter sp.]
MLNIILCEDNQAVIDLVTKFVENYCRMEGMSDVKIELATGDPIAVLDLFRANVAQPDGTIKQVANTLKHRLLFLDIDLGDLGKVSEMNGISLAREIRKYDIGADIVFLTHNQTTISDIVSYKIAPIAFLNKPYLSEDTETLQKDVLEILRFSYDRMSRSQVDKKMIEFKTGHRKVYVNLADVYFIQVNEERGSESASEESRSALTILHESSGAQYLKRSLSFYDKSVPELVKLGKFYLINPLNVKFIEFSGRYAYIRMHGDHEIRVTRKALEDYEKLLSEMNDKE